MAVERRELTIKQKVFRAVGYAVTIAGVAFVGFNFVTEAIPANFNPSSPKFKSSWPNLSGWTTSYSFENCGGLLCEPENPESTSANFSGIIDTSKESSICPTLQYSHSDDSGAFLLHTSTWRLIPGTCREQ